MSPPDVGLGSRVSEFQRGLGLGSRSSREGWVSGLGLWGPPEAGFWSLNQVKTGKFCHGARQNCIFPSFMQRKSPAEHLHISDTSDSNVGFWVLDQFFFGYNTKLPLHRSARSARQIFGPLRAGSRVSELRRGLGLGSRSSREGWVSGLGVRP
jgi:hypothetical protein